ncbi:hypothetical protein SAMN04487968_105233 [Nocardioides terrae]|uniref:Uncharacterized protein n=1 Tax=Nocardioides terrae TaxID=574651 RepID=A0A1I1ICV8_9ACTN|nr:hypothetical protein SAMN04487968_105233 [Nocardioides terrae]
MVRDIDGELGAPIEEVAQDAVDATAGLYTSDASLDVEEQLRIQLHARGIAAVDEASISELAHGIRSGHHVSIAGSDGPDVPLA